MEASPALNRRSISGSSAPERRRIYRSSLGAVAISAAIVALLSFLLPWGEVRRLWADVSPLGLVAAAAAIACGHVATGFRIQTMVPAGTPITLRDGVFVSLWHGCAMILLPARLGELALVEALARSAKVGRGTGLAVLLVQRTYDGLFACAALALGAYGTMFGRTSVGLVAAALVGLLAISRWLDPILGWCAARFASLPGAPARRLQTLLLDARSGVQSTSREGAPILVLGALLFWATEVAALWFVFRAFGTSLDPLTTLFLAGGLALVYALPLPTIGGLGLAEGGLAALLAAAGWPTDLAVGLGVSARIALLAAHAAVVALLLPAFALRRSLA